MSGNTDFTGDGVPFVGLTTEVVQGALDGMRNSLGGLRGIIKDEQIKMLAELTEILGTTNNIVLEKMVVSQQLILTAVEKLAERQKGTVSEGDLVGLVDNVTKVVAMALDVQQTTSARLIKIAGAAERILTQAAEAKQ